MNYYKRHIGDYAKKAGKLTMLQHGAYTALIDACYDRERFPTMDEAIDWTWASTQDEVQAVQFVLSKFFIKQDDGTYFQDRISEELHSYKAISETNKRIALEREARKKSTKRERVVNEPPPNHKPITNNHKPSIDNKEVADAPVVTPEALDTLEFATAWQEYISYRSLNKLKSLKRPSIQRIFDNMAKWGHDAAIQSIHNTIQNGWQGIFEPKTQFTTQPKHDHRAEKRAREFPEQIVVPLI